MSNDELKKALILIFMALLAFLVLFLPYFAEAAVRGLVATQTAPGQVTLTWDPNSEDDLAGYRIYWGTASRVYGHVQDVGNVTLHTIDGLSEGVEYFFAATAYDTATNESGYSNEVRATIQSQPPPPPPPPPQTQEDWAVYVTADNEYELFVNGGFLGSGNNWTVAQSYVFTPDPVKNVVAVKARNWEGAAGVVASVVAPDTVYLSDATWKAGSPRVQGWQEKDLDDSAWDNATEYGPVKSASPWIDYRRVALVDGNSAWIWSGNNRIPGDSVVVRLTIGGEPPPPPVERKVLILYQVYSVTGLDTVAVKSDTIDVKIDP